LAQRAGVPLVGINYKDAPEDARAFLTKLGNPFARIGVDSSGRASIDWGVFGVPETYVVDGKGTITYKHIGPISPTTIETDLLPAIVRARR
jgi:cytochrome c biogenesis protein CcmG, thiol:disulfide interchange protein DsbE